MRAFRLLLVVLVVALAASAAASADPGITVTGAGSATATSDLATYGFGVSAPGRTSSGALRVAGSRVRAVLGTLRSAGVAPGDVQTTALTITRSVRRDRRGTRRRVVSYRAASTVQVTARGPAQIRAVPSRAVAAGATLRDGPNFSLADTTGLGRRALTSAFDDARTKAAALAQEAGVTLGPPVSITEGTPTVEPEAQSQASTGAPRSTPATPVPVSPGEQTVAATVTVVFAISA